ncbi:MAG: hypothetical protein QXF20_02960 [Candidatus Hadarchaeales archaeon]
MVPLKGFFPLTASALLLLFLSLTLSLQVLRLEHLRSSFSLQEVSLLELLVAGTNVRKDLEDLCRYATYQALWEVGRETSYGTGERRKEAVENLAETLFLSFLPSLPSLYSHTDERLLFLGGKEVDFTLSPLENGFCLLKVRMPANILSVTSPDRSSSFLLPLEELEVFIDSRFFLLQERACFFLEHLGEMEGLWGVTQYLYAWPQVLSGRIELSPSFVEKSFLAAWSAHELKSFGSCYSPLHSFPSLASRREVLLHLRTMRDGVEHLYLELKKNLGNSIPVEGKKVMEKLEDLEGKWKELQSMVEGSEDPLVRMLSDSFLPELHWKLKELKSLLRLEEKEGENRSTLSLEECLSLLAGESFEENREDRSLLLLLRGAVEEFERIAAPLPVGDLLNFPSKEDPKLSVFRELEIKGVRFRREDPLGLCGLSSATPIPLPFLGVRIWWAQWRTEVILEREPVEEIVDHPYPTLLLPGVHARVPLSYRFEIPKRKFEARVIVFSPLPFSVFS